MEYDQDTQKIRGALLRGTNLRELQPIYSDKSISKSTAILMTHESLDTLEEMFGPPASDLEILCAPDISVKLAHEIYSNVGIPHYYAFRQNNNTPALSYRNDNIYKYAQEKADFVFCHEPSVLSWEDKQRIKKLLKRETDNRHRYEPYCPFDENDVEDDLTAAIIDDKRQQSSLRSAAIRAFRNWDWEDTPPPLLILLPKTKNAAVFLRDNGNGLKENMISFSDALAQGELPLRDTSNFILDHSHSRAADTALSTDHVQNNESGYKPGQWLAQYLEDKSNRHKGQNPAEPYHPD